MAERASVFQACYLGPEVTAGTRVDATKKLGCTYINADPDVPISMFRPRGSKFNTTATRAKEMTNASLEGAIGYNDLSYLLSSLIEKVAPVVAGSVGTWTFKPSPTGADDVQTYTVQTGSEEGAEDFLYGIVSGLGFSFAEGEASLQGSMFGRALNEAATLDATPDEVIVMPVDPDSVTVYAGDAVGSLVALDNCLRAEFGINGTRRPLKTLKKSQASFTKPVNLAPEMRGSITIEHDATAAAFMADLRAKDTKFLRIEAEGPVIASATTYLLQITFPFKFMAPRRSDVDDVYASAFGVEAIYDPTFGSAIEVVLRNAVTAL